MDWDCKKCGFELVQIKRDTLVQIKKALNPKFLGLPENWYVIESWIPICPKCNANPLGLRYDLHFTIRTKSGDLTNINDLDFIKASKHSDKQKEILSSDICGCFRCLQTFKPDEISEWHEATNPDPQYEPLGFCPKCGMDSIIGSASGYPIEYSFLKKMKDFWFSESTFVETMGG